jgi:hypothetical protein
VQDGRHSFGPIHAAPHNDPETMVGAVTAQCIAQPNLTALRRKACAFISRPGQSA